MQIICSCKSAVVKIVRPVYSVACEGGVKLVIVRWPSSVACEGQKRGPRANDRIAVTFEPIVFVLNSSRFGMSNKRVTTYVFYNLVPVLSV